MVDSREKTRTVYSTCPDHHNNSYTIPISILYMFPSHYSKPHWSSDLTLGKEAKLAKLPKLSNFSFKLLQAVFPHSVLYFPQIPKKREDTCNIPLKPLKPLKDYYDYGPWTQTCHRPSTTHTYTHSLLVPSPSPQWPRNSMYYFEIIIGILICNIVTYAIIHLKTEHQPKKCK